VVGEDVRRVLQRLRAALVQADDRQARMRDVDCVVGPEADPVRSAPPEPAQEPMVERLLATRHDEDAAHGAGYSLGPNPIRTPSLRASGSRPSNVRSRVGSPRKCRMPPGRNPPTISGGQSPPSVSAMPSHASISRVGPPEHTFITAGAVAPASRASIAS